MLPNAQLEEEAHAVLAEELKRKARSRRFEAEEELQSTTGKETARRKKADKLEKEAKDFEERANHLKREACRKLNEALKKAKPRGSGASQVREVSLARLKEWYGSSGGQMRRLVLLICCLAAIF